jgi:carbon-monoxide dehydrogenase medium subunit
VVAAGASVELAGGTIARAGIALAAAGGDITCAAAEEALAGGRRRTSCSPARPRSWRRRAAPSPTSAGSADYKRHVAGVLTERVLRRATPRPGGERLMRNSPAPMHRLREDRRFVVTAKDGGGGRWAPC